MSKIEKILLTLFIFVGIIFYIWQKNERFNIRYRINRLETQIKEIKTKNNALRFEINKSISMENLEKNSQKLGMVKTETKNIVYLKNE